VPGQVKPFRLAKRDITSEERQRAEVQQERPSGVHSGRIPVVQHAKKLKDDIVFQHPSQQWRTHGDDEPDPAKQAGKESAALAGLNSRCCRLWRRRRHFPPGRCRRFPLSLWKLDDVRHRNTSANIDSLKSGTDGASAFSAPSSRKRSLSTLTLLKRLHALAAKKFLQCIFNALPQAPPLPTVFCHQQEDASFRHQDARYDFSKNSYIGKK
jgi:hypothetical protein